MPHGLKAADPLDLADAIRRRRQQVAQQGAEPLSEPSPAQRNAGLLALEQLIDERVGAGAMGGGPLGPAARGALIGAAQTRAGTSARTEDEAAMLPVDRGRPAALPAEQPGAFTATQRPGAREQAGVLGAAAGTATRPAQPAAAEPVSRAATRPATPLQSSTTGQVQDTLAQDRFSRAPIQPAAGPAVGGGPAATTTQAAFQALSQPTTPGSAARFQEQQGVLEGRPFAPAAPAPRTPAPATLAPGVPVVGPGTRFQEQQGVLEGRSFVPATPATPGVPPAGSAPIPVEADLLRPERAEAITTSPAPAQGPGLVQSIGNFFRNFLENRRAQIEGQGERAPAAGLPTSDAEIAQQFQTGATRTTAAAPGTARTPAGQTTTGAGAAAAPPGAPPGGEAPPGAPEAGPAADPWAELADNLLSGRLTGPERDAALQQLRDAAAAGDPAAQTALDRLTGGADVGAPGGPGPGATTTTGGGPGPGGGTTGEPGAEGGGPRSARELFELIAQQLREQGVEVPNLDELRRQAGLIAETETLPAAQALERERLRLQREREALQPGGALYQQIVGPFDQLEQRLKALTEERKRQIIIRVNDRGFFYAGVLDTLIGQAEQDLVQTLGATAQERASKLAELALRLAVQEELLAQQGIDLAQSRGLREAVALDQLRREAEQRAFNQRALQLSNLMQLAGLMSEAEHQQFVRTIQERQLALDRAEAAATERWRNAQLGLQARQVAVDEGRLALEQTRTTTERALAPGAVTFDQLSQEMEGLLQEGNDPAAIEERIDTLEEMGLISAETARRLRTFLAGLLRDLGIEDERMPRVPRGAEPLSVGVPRAQ